MFCYNINILQWFVYMDLYSYLFLHNMITFTVTTDLQRFSLHSLPLHNFFATLSVGIFFLCRILSGRDKLLCLLDIIHIIIHCTLKTVPTIPKWASPQRGTILSHKRGARNCRILTMWHTDKPLLSDAALSIHGFGETCEIFPGYKVSTKVSHTAQHMWNNGDISEAMTVIMVCKCSVGPKCSRSSENVLLLGYLFWFIMIFI